MSSLHSSRSNTATSEEHRPVRLLELKNKSGRGLRQLQAEAGDGLIPGMIRKTNGEPVKPFIFARSIIDRWLDGETILNANSTPSPKGKK